MTAYGGNKLLGVNLNRKTDAADHTLGAHVFDEETGKCYRYVKFIDAVTYAANKCVVIAGTNWEVTNDVSGGTAMAGFYPVGIVFADVPTENQYGWVQCGGIASIVAGSASIIAGDLLKPDESEDGDVDEATEGTDENIVGIALATIADNATGSALLAIRH